MYLCFSFQVLDYAYRGRASALLYIEFDIYNITAKCPCKQIICESVIALTGIYDRKSLSPFPWRINHQLHFFFFFPPQRYLFINL